MAKDVMLLVDGVQHRATRGKAGLELRDGEDFARAKVVEQRPPDFEPPEGTTKCPECFGKAASDD